MPAKPKPSDDELTMEHARQDAKKAMAMAKAKYAEAEERMRKAIEKDPVQAAMIAAGIGAAIGAAVTFAIMKKKKKE